MQTTALEIPVAVEGMQPSGGGVLGRVSRQIITQRNDQFLVKVAQKIDPLDYVWDRSVPKERRRRRAEKRLSKRVFFGDRAHANGVVHSKRRTSAF